MLLFVLYRTIRYRRLSTSLIQIKSCFNKCHCHRDLYEHNIGARYLQQDSLLAKEFSQSLGAFCNGLDQYDHRNSCQSCFFIPLHRDSIHWVWFCQIYYLDSFIGVIVVCWGFFPLLFRYSSLTMQSDQVALFTITYVLFSLHLLFGGESYLQQFTLVFLAFQYFQGLKLNPFCFFSSYSSAAVYRTLGEWFNNEPDCPSKSSNSQKQKCCFITNPWKRYSR